LTSSNRCVSPASPGLDADRRRTATTHPGDDSALTPTTGLADQRQRLWYLGGFVPGVLLPRHDNAALDLNANGKRPFDRCAVTS